MHSELMDTERVELSPLLDAEALDLLHTTFEAMDSLDRDPSLKGKVNVRKGIEWTRIMGSHDSMLEDSPDSFAAKTIWTSRVKRYSFYSDTARNESHGHWFDFEAWRKYHECMLRGQSDEFPYTESPITLPKLKRQLQDEIDRMKDAELDRQMELPNGKTLHAKQSRHDCCMFGD